MKRTTRKYDLNTGTLAAKGLYNITPKDGNDKRCSAWFAKETYQELKRMKAAEFNAECEKYLTE